MVTHIFNLLNNTNVLFDELQNKLLSFTSLSQKESKTLRYIILFLLRLKLLGDHIQAFEASNILTSQNFDNNFRILTTDDRVLAAYCLVNNNINFISKCTLNNKQFLIMNIL